MPRAGGWLTGRRNRQVAVRAANHIHLGRYDEALARLDRALTITEAARGPDHHETARTLNNKGLVLADRADFTGAEHLYQRALAIREAQLGLDHPDTATSLNNLAGLLRDQGKLAEAEPLLKRAWEILETSVGPDHANTKSTLLGYVRTLLDRGRSPRSSSPRSPREQA